MSPITCFLTGVSLTPFILSLLEFLLFLWQNEYRFSELAQNEDGKAKSKKMAKKDKKKVDLENLKREVEMVS